MADIASQIPEAARLPGFDPELSIELPCRDIFAGPVPRLSLSRLAEIASKHVCLPAVPDFAIMLPAAQLALAYRFVDGRESVDAAGNERPDARASDSDYFFPKPETTASAQGFQGDACPAEREALTDPLSGQPAERETSSQLPAGAISLCSQPGSSTVVQETDALKPQPPTHLPPILGEVILAGEQPARTPRPAVIREAVLEHLPKAEDKPLAEIPDQDGLQAIFLTEEFLSVNRVVELCGDLPGIRSCVLARGAAVVASVNVPESIDLVSLSAHAVEMLTAMRQSAAKMGIGAVPALTVHSEKGPITFFHRDDLCLLVLHKDRGFVPGVREKLQEVVEHLSRANLPLPANVSRPALAPRDAAS